MALQSNAYEAISNPSGSDQESAVLLGDCLEILPRLPSRSAGFVLTDPPYIVRYRSRDGRTIANDDNDAWLLPAFAETFRVLENHSFAVSFYGWPHTDKFMKAFRKAGFSIVGHLVCPKPYTSSTSFLQYQHESAFLLAKGYPRRPANPIPDVLPWRYSGNRLHPTQKPLSALKPLVGAFCDPSGLVLDPFAGSGSSLVAAAQLGRRYLGVELDPGYHAAATARLKALAAKPSVPLTAAA